MVEYIWVGLLPNDQTSRQQMSFQYHYQRIKKNTADLCFYWQEPILLPQAATQVTLSKWWNTTKTTMITLDITCTSLWAENSDIAVVTVCAQDKIHWWNWFLYWHHWQQAMNSVSGNITFHPRNRTIGKFDYHPILSIVILPMTATRLGLTDSLKFKADRTSQAAHIK